MGVEDIYQRIRERVDPTLQLGFHVVPGRERGHRTLGVDHELGSAADRGVDHDVAGKEQFFAAAHRS
jgi:hypothetical protein